MAWWFTRRFALQFSFSAPSGQLWCATLLTMSNDGRTMDDGVTYASGGSSKDQGNIGLIKRGNYEATESS